jgi:uncharacterized membrane protein YphA (DoxX/SURF4 family)
MAVPASNTGFDSPTSVGAHSRELVHRAYVALWFIFTAAPIIAGLDKFLGLLTDWDKYLAPVVSGTLGIAPHTFMLVVGAIEIVAGLLIAVKPRIGSVVVAAWLAGIILNLVLNPNHYWDVALRDLGLMVGAIALHLLATAEEESHRAA